MFQNLHLFESFNCNLQRMESQIKCNHREFFCWMEIDHLQNLSPILNNKLIKFIPNFLLSLIIICSLISMHFRLIWFFQYFIILSRFRFSIQKGMWRRKIRNGQDVNQQSRSTDTRGFILHFFSISIVLFLFILFLFFLHLLNSKTLGWSWNCSFLRTNWYHKLSLGRWKCKSKHFGFRSQTTSLFIVTIWENWINWTVFEERRKFACYW